MRASESGASRLAQRSKIGEYLANRADQWLEDWLVQFLDVRFYSGDETSQFRCRSAVVGTEVTRLKLKIGIDLG